MNITQQDAEDIINRMSENFLTAVDNTYKLNRVALINKILSLNNMNHVVAPNKDKIDLAIMGSPEDNEYYQYYFLIVEEGKLTPHHIERLERRKIEQNISTNTSIIEETTTNEIEIIETQQENNNNSNQNIVTNTKNNNPTDAKKGKPAKRKAANKKPTKPNTGNNTRTNIRNTNSSITTRRIGANKRSTNSRTR